MTAQGVSMQSSAGLAILHYTSIPTLFPVFTALSSSTARGFTVLCISAIFSYAILCSQVFHRFGLICLGCISIFIKLCLSVRQRPSQLRFGTSACRHYGLTVIPMAGAAELPDACWVIELRGSIHFSCGSFLVFSTFLGSSRRLQFTTIFSTFID